uniref:ATP synthase F0 subunit 8 n=1 Tax=Haemopis sanguisuga TaxID=51991 RepID=A0A7L7S4A5_9ANNE|nr:ATP synthase F0 subunit 8 [Haemopis sanguisuga]
MPHLSPMHWLFMLVTLWLLLFGIITMMWWYTYYMYMNISYPNVNKVLFMW